MDSELKVKGVKGVRIVDAGVIVSAFLLPVKGGLLRYDGHDVAVCAVGAHSGSGIRVGGEGSRFHSQLVVTLEW